MKFRRPTKLSSNIEDRRGARSRRRPGGRTAAGVGGAGGAAAIVAVLAAFCAGGGGGLPGSGFQVDSGPALGAGAPVTDLEAPLDPGNDPNREAAEVASVVIDSVQEYWAEVFAENGRTYQPATLVLFTGSTSTACGEGSAATGPFYCSLDQNAYIDLSFWDQLESQFGASGDFAQAYVIAHEVAHHVQNLLGVSDEVRALSAQNPADRNALSVRQELQADCFAGAWAGVVFNEGGDITLDEDDITEALGAAAAVGDDRIQQATTGRLEPEKWTHGSAEQRKDWFLRGFETGNPSDCDTFS